MADGPILNSAPLPTEAGAMQPKADEALAWLRLIRSRRVGPTTFWRLLAEHGSASAALDALPAMAKVAGIADYTPWTAAQARAEASAARRVGARLVMRGMESYPDGLKDLPDAPPLFWVIGDPTLLSRPMVALVGARNASSLGLRMARRLAGDLREAGFVVVSGLARGIDAAAHDAALPGATVAVQAGGVDHIYPQENASLAARIAETGCRLSEQALGLAPQARHFPLRNRLISGLARAVVVVEAAARSGSLITARTALDQGREVFAVPGHPFDGRAGGCNQLIRDGATLIRGAADVIEALAPEAEAPRPQAALPLPPTPVPAKSQPNSPPGDTPLRRIATLHRQILDRLGPSPLAEDQLIRDLCLAPAEVAPHLTTLELDGKLQRQPGGLIARLH